MANQNFRVKKGLEVGLGATFLYADDTGVGINSTSPRSNLDVRGTAQATDVTVDNNLEVQGLSTFTGIVTTGSDLYVGRDLYVKNSINFDSLSGDELLISGIATINQLEVQSDLEVAGITTLNVVDSTSINVSGASTFTGIVTTGDDLYVGGNLYVFNDIFYDEINGRNLNITGISTLNDLLVGGATTFSGLVSFRDAVGTALTVRNITAHTGDFVEINVSGGGGGGGGTGIDSTSVTTNNLLVTGVATFTTGVTTQLFAENILAGVITTTDLRFNSGIGTSLTVTNLDVTGIATLNGTGIATIGGDPVFNDLVVLGVSSLGGNVIAGSNLNVGAALSVAGDSFVSGVGTFASNLEVKGDLILDGDIELDTVIGENLTISGVGTINTLKSNVGIITTANIEDLNVSGISTVGVLTVYETLADSKAQVGYGDSILATVGGKLLWTRPDQIGIATAFQPGSTFYVAENGSDANDGLSPEKAWASVGYALSQIPNTLHDILEIGAGEYIETFPLTVPKGLTVQGAGQRATLIKPSQATETSDGFLLNDRSTVQDLTINGFYKPVGTQNYAFKLAVGAALTTRSPYVDRVTVINQGTNISADDPYGYNSADSYPTQAPGGGGVLIDGSVVTTDSPYASILANELTLFTPGSRGIEITNGGRMEWLNGFVYFASEAVVGVSDRGTGLAGQGKTRLTLENASGGLTGGNTVQYYDSDGTTVLASGTIDNVSGSYVTLTNSGVGTFAVPRNRSAKNVDFVGTAQLSTAQAKFGSSSLDLTGAGTDEITVDSHPDFGFGTGDFTVEFWIYRTGNINGKVFYDNRDTADTDSALVITGNGGNETDVYIGNTSIITGTVATTLNAWNHVAVVRSGGTITQYIDGVVSGTPVAAANDLGSSRQLSFGDKYDGSNNGPTAYFDELRITKGAAKYSGAFTPPAAALKGDKDTSILLHFEGVNGATTTTDDILVYQDIRITGGNTADKVTLADYSQFGADLRSIACAIEYGNQGMIGNGDGVTLRAISINFNHVGALGDFSNDPNLAVQANEVIELNNAEVSYVSIDQKGDFRVGEAFYVNQETGEVSFTDTVTDLTALSSLTITDGTNNSIITPTSGRFGNVLISGQSVESVTGDLNLKTGGSGEVNIYGNTNVIGILTAQIIEINAIQKGDTAIALDDSGVDGTIRFITDGVEAQRITNNQRVGINTTNPAGQLEVRGGTTLENLNVTGIATLNGTGIATIGGSPVFRDLQVTGFSTFAGLGTFQDDLYVGGNLNVLGDIKFDEVDARNANITGIATVGFASVGDLRVSGGSTFLGDVEINGDLTISGDQIVDSLGVTDLAVTGVATIGFLTATDAHVGNGLTVANLTVTGEAQLNGAGIVTAGQDINFRNLEIAGLSTFVGLQSFRSAVGTALTVFSLTVPDNGVVSLPGIPVSGGDAEFRNLNVTGVSSFAGVATFASDLFVDGNLFVEGLDFRETLAGENLLVAGVGTINTLKTNVGIITHLSVTGPSTLSGIVTTGSDLYVGGNLYVYNDIFYDEINGRNLNISGVATIGFLSATDLRVSSGATFLSDIRVDGDASIAFATITEAYVGVLTVGKFDSGSSTIDNDISTRNLEVTGLSTFVGVATFQDNLNISGDLNVSGDTTVRNTLGVAATFSDKLEVPNLEFTDGTGETLGLEEITVTDASIGVATAGFATITQAYIGILTVGLIDNGAGTVIGDDITTRNLEVTGLSTFVGVATFQDDLYVGGDLNVLGDIAFDEVDARNANITGIATVGYASVTDASIGLATISQAEVNIINGNQGNFTNLFVPGIATIGNLISDGGDQIIIEGSTVITGIVTIGGNSITIDGNASYENIRLGPAGTPAVVSGAQTDGKRTFAWFEDGRFDIMNVNGITTTTDLNVSSAATITDLVVTGSVNIPGIFNDDAEFRNLKITGVSTFIGLATFTNTLVHNTADINEALIADATIGYADLTESNIGVTTIGIADITDTTIGVATVGFATINQAYVGLLTVGVFDGGGTTIGNDLTTRNLKVTGLSTFVGVVTTLGDLYVGGDLFVYNDIKYDEINGRNLNISGISTLGGIEIASGIITSVSGIVTYYGDGSHLVKLRVAAGIVTDNAPLERPTGDDLQEGDLWFDSTELRQYTYYTGLWVDSNPQRTIPPLNFSGNEGASTLSLETDVFNVIGVNNVRTVVGLGSTVQIGLTTDVTLGRNFEVTGVSTFDGNVDIIGDLEISGDLSFDEFTARNINVTGIGSIVTLETENANITDADIGYLNGTDVNVSSGLTASNATFSTLEVINGATLRGAGIVTEGSDPSFRSLIVSGVTTLGVVTGATYYGDGSNLTGIEAAIDGLDVSLGNLEVSGLSTFTGIVTTLGDLYVGGDLFVYNDIKYDEINGRNLNISGISTLSTVQISSGIISSTTGVVTYYGDGSNLTGIDIVTGKDITPRNINVSGLSTFTGIVTTLGDLYVGGDLFVYNDIKYDEINGRNLNISGVSTLGTVQISSGVITATSGVVTYYGDGSNLSGVGTLGGDADFRNVDVSGILTTNYLDAQDARVAGVITAGLFVGNGGGLTSLNINGYSPSFAGLVVSGVTTLGLLTTTDDVYVSGLVTARRYFGDVSGVTGINSALSGTNLDLNNLTVSGVTTVGLLSATNIVASNQITAGLFVGSGAGLTSLNIDGYDVRLRNLEVSGLSTFVGTSTCRGDLFVSNAIQVIGTKISRGIVTHTSTAGVVTYYGDGSNLTGIEASIDGGNVSLGNLEVTGLSTFVGVGTFQNDLYVGGDLNVLGDIKYDELTGRNLSISGISTLGTVQISSGVIDATTGVVTYYGDGSNLTGIEASIDGGDLSLNDLEVTGVSTFVGVATFQDDLYVGGDLNVLGDIKYDELTGRNLSISGISTLGTVQISSGVINATTGVVTYYGDGSNLTGIDIVTGKDITPRNLKVTGLSTFVGVATFQNDLYVGGDIIGDGATNITNIDDVTTVAGGSVSIGGSITMREAPTGVGGVYFDNSVAGIGTLFVVDDATVGGDFGVVGNSFLDGNITGFGGTISGYSDIVSPLFRSNLVSSLQVNTNYLFGQDINATGVVTALKFIGDGSELIGVGASFISIVDSSQPTQRPDASALVNGDLWFDSSSLRQYTYYFDGVTAQWVDSNPQRTVPPLNFAGNSGTGSVGLRSDVFTIVGGNNIYTVGSGVTLTVGVSTNVTVGFLTATDVWVSGMVTAQNVTSLSDRNLKEDIKPIEGALSKVQQLNGVSFKWKEDEKQSIGVIAQDVEAVFPELVSGDNPKSVNYNGLIGVLIESIKELKSENEILKTRIENLEGR